MRTPRSATPLLLVAGLATSVAAEPPTPPTPVPLQICLDAAADSSPVYPTDEVPASNREVKAVFRLGDGVTAAKLTSTWIAEDVGEVAAPNTVIAKNDLPLKDKPSGVLRVSLPRDLPVGRYRLDAALDGKPWASADFRVVAPPPMPTLSDPGKPFSLAPGTKWTYDFVAEPARGVTLTLPGTKADERGVLRTATEYVVVGQDAAGAHLEMRRGGELGAEEWWRFSAKGLELVHRKADETLTVLDPPRPALPMPLERTASWTWQPKGGAKVEARAWGPVPVRVPAGEIPGWVVLEREPTRFAGYPMLQTTERHWAPGVGLVRETLLIATAAGKRVVRMESVLRSTTAAAK
jgi:hypothetical protein